MSMMPRLLWKYNVCWQQRYADSNISKYSIQAALINVFGIMMYQLKAKGHTLFI